MCTYVQIQGSLATMSPEELDIYEARLLQIKRIRALEKEVEEV